MGLDAVELRDDSEVLIPDALDLWQERFELGKLDARRCAIELYALGDGALEGLDGGAENWAHLGEHGAELSRAVEALQGSKTVQEVYVLGVECDSDADKSIFVSSDHVNHCMKMITPLFV